MEQTQKNKKLILYTFLEVVCTLMLTIVGSMWDWVNMEFTLSRISTGAYWNDVVVQTTMYSCAMLIGIFATLERNELSNMVYYELLITYREKLKIKDRAFIPYIDNVLNPSIKKEWIKKRYEKKLYKLDKHAKDIWMLEYNKRKKLAAKVMQLEIESKGSNNIKANLELKAAREELASFKFSTPLSEEYYKKKTMLEEMASEKYIEENWETMNIAYPKVNPYAFTYYLDINMSDDAIYKVENQTARELPFKILRKFMFSMGGALIIGLLIISPDSNALLEQANGWIALMIQYIVRVGMIFGNLALGVFVGRRTFKDNFILPITNRTRILEEYGIYKDNHPDLTRVEEMKNELAREYDEKVKLKVQEAIDETRKIYETDVQ